MLRYHHKCLRVFATYHADWTEAHPIIIELIKLEVIILKIPGNYIGLRDIWNFQIGNEPLARFRMLSNRRPVQSLSHCLQLQIGDANRKRRILFGELPLKNSEHLRQTKLGTWKRTNSAYERCQQRKSGPQRLFGQRVMAAHHLSLISCTRIDIWAQ